MTTNELYNIATEWIAENDAPGDADELDVLAGYLTVCLVAYTFNKSPETVARKVLKIRDTAA